MNPIDTTDLWWRTAVFYCLDVETFQDSDGNGSGDFRGLAHRIDYLAELGVTCLWLMPFQPTRDLDDGYDVTDFYSVDPRLGDLGTFVEVVRIAHDHGIRVIIDLVINHTSDRHPWFTSAKRSRDSPYRDYYVWVDEPPPNPQKSMFPGEEDGVWEKDGKTGQYYLHSFYHHQPDLNLANPAVRSEISRVVGFWAQLGVDGFRVDAVPFIIQPPGAADADNPHGFLRELHRFVGRRMEGAALLGEVALPHDEQLEYFGTKGTELDLQFDFASMQAAFLSFARHDAGPIARALAERPSVDASQGWAMFLRNHDELTLELLSDDERQEVFETFAPDERQRVFGRGIVRRLAPMLQGDPRRLRHAYSLLFSLPGAPVLFYGEEIGMGELPGVPDREVVRTPMQWDKGRGAGFSDARASKLPARIPDTGYGPDHVNVEDQLRDQDSLLSFIRLLIARYRSTPVIAWGMPRVLDTGDSRVLARAGIADDETFIAVHNFSPEPCRVMIPFEADGDAPLVDLLEPGPAPVVEGGRIALELDGYGYRWLHQRRV